jgi:predicted ATPase/DNA-binding SARP family transcriptional activator
MPTLLITLAGNVIVDVDGCRLADEALGPRGRVVLACLVLERHRLLPAGELAEATWGIELPPTWRPALRNILTRVRRFLGLPRPDGAIALERRPGCYQLRLPASAEVDVEQAVVGYEAARASLAAGDELGALKSARAAANSCRHEFLPGGSGEWVEAQQQRLSNLYLASLELVSEAAAASRDWDTAREAAEEMLAREPYRESAYILLMSALAGAGNVSGAMLAYKRCCDVLEQELGAPPSRPTRDAFLALMRKAETEEADSQPRTNVPAAVSTFVGHTERIVALRARLTSTRLVTLTGTAGVGKSRVAMEATRPLAANFADGVWLAELAEITIGVGRHVAAVFRLPDSRGRDPVESLCEHLAAKELLVVLDNCEHVLGESADLARRLLATCARVRILATSREPLHVSGEVTWPVEPLSLPTPSPGNDPVDYFSAEAVQLFADRASSARPGLDVDLQAVADACARLDGIPLAIELAAAHARVFTVGELATLLAEQPQLVTRTTTLGDAGRHGSMAAALDWSYERLEEDERAVLRWLSVFAGGFTAEAAESVCSNLALDDLGVITDLVDKSLVVARQGAKTRFRLLETVRAYAWAKLVTAGEEVQVRTHHLDWACALAGGGAEHRRQPLEAAVLDRLDAERGNLSAALQWSVDSNQEERGLRLAVALAPYWEIRGYLEEGRSWLVQLAAPEQVRPEPKAAALSAAGVLANHQSDFTAARAMHAEALGLRRSLGDLRAVAGSLNGLASVAVSAGDYEAARPMLEEILDIGRRLQDRHVTAACLVNLAAVTEHAVEEGVVWPYSLADAREWLLEASTILREVGDLRGVAQTLENLGVVSAMEGHLDRARTYFRQCLELYRLLGDKKGVAGTVRFLGQLSFRDGDYGAAEALLEECLSFERELGSVQRSAEALGVLGAIAQAAGRAADARALYRESLAAYAQAGNPSGADDVLRRLLALEPLPASEPGTRQR